MRVALMWSISEASVVDFPEPVGPVTSTSPRGLSASGSMCWGRPSSDERADLGRDHPEGGAERPPLEEDVHAEAADAGDRVRHVDVAARLEHLLLLGREDPVEEVARVFGGQELMVLERLELPAARTTGFDSAVRWRSEASRSFISRTRSSIERASIAGSISAAAGSAVNLD